MAKGDGRKTAKNANEDDIGSVLMMARLERLARLMRQASHGYGLNPVQWEALRYLARANRLSNSPGALARYLGSTKGTVSQTVLALEKKGLVSKQARSQDERSVALALSAEAYALLAKDPLSALTKEMDNFGGKTRKRLGRGISLLLASEISRQDEPSFGSCQQCRYFREGDIDQPLTCMKDGATLSAGELSLICVEHSVR